MNAALTVLLTTLADGGLGPDGEQALRELAVLLPGMPANSAPEALADAVATQMVQDPVLEQKLLAWKAGLAPLLEADLGTARAVAMAMETHAPGSGGWYQGDHLDFGTGFFRGTVIGKQIINNYYDGPGPRPPFRQPQAQLPPATVGFAGRTEDLERLLTALQPHERPKGHLPQPLSSHKPRAQRPVAAVTGMAGVGKTAFAVQAAHLADDRNWFPGGTLFIDMEGYSAHPLAPDRALPSLLRALGARPEDIPMDGNEHAGHYRTFLKASERVLIVLDNVSSPGQVQPLLPGDARHRVLITSRDKLTQLGAYVLSLEELTPSASLELLDHALRDTSPDEDRRMTDDPDSALQLAILCGHLPLALQIAAALLAIDRAKPLRELVDELTESRTRIDMLDDGYRSVRAAFDLSYRRLRSEDARLLRLLAMSAGPEVGADALVALLGDLTPNPAVLNRALGALERVYLAERGSARERWRLHDLVRAYAMNIVSGDTELSEEGITARQRLLAYYWKRADAADNDLRRRDRTSPAEEQAALAWFDLERLILVAAVQWGVEEERHAVTAVDLALCLTEYLRRRGYTDDAITVSKTSMEAARLAEDPLRESISVRSYGDALQRAGRFHEAADAFRHARRLFQELKDRSGEAQVLGDLAIALTYLTRYEEAEEALLSALAAHVDFGNRQDEARVLNNLGVIFQDRRRFIEAVDAFNRARSIFHELGDALNEGAAWTNLGAALGAMGDAVGAAEAYERDGEIRERLTDWYGVGQAFRAGARMWERAGEPTSARASWQRAGKAFRLAGAEGDAQDAQKQEVGD